MSTWYSLVLVNMIYLYVVWASCITSRCFFGKAFPFLRPLAFEMNLLMEVTSDSHSEEYLQVQWWSWVGIFHTALPRNWSHWATAIWPHSHRTFCDREMTLKCISTLFKYSGCVWVYVSSSYNPAEKVWIFSSGEKWARSKKNHCTKWMTSTHTVKVPLLPLCNPLSKICSRADCGVGGRSAF